MIKQPLVCICIPNYNNETTISKTLDSILNQTYSNVIIKVFDNASTDGSLKILKEYENKYSNFTVFINEENIGGEANFTRCIENMDGVYSAIYHSDDIYMPTMIEEEVKALQNNDISAVFTNANIIDKNDKIINKINIPHEFINKTNYTQISFIELIKSNMKNDNFLVCPTAMAKTEIYKEYIKSWDGSQYKSATDTSIWLKFAYLGKIGLLTKELINYRYSLDSFSYRRLRTRVTSKDYFLVMDDYLTKEEVKKNISNEDYNNYKFLKFKDNVVIKRNSIINGLIIDGDIDVFDRDIMKVAILNRRNFLYYCGGIFYSLVAYKNIVSHIFKFMKNAKVDS